MTIQYGEVDLDITNPQVESGVTYYVNTLTYSAWTKHIERGWVQTMRDGMFLDLNGEIIPPEQLV